MRLNLSGAPFVVTGGGSGIGLAVARELGSEGAEVLIVGRDRSRLTEATAACADLPGKVRSHALDVTASTAPGDLLAVAQDLFGSPTGLVNAAGSIRLHDLAAAPDAEWDAQWELNVEAPRRLMDLFAPAMAAGGGGAIVNVCSSAGRRPSSAYPAYAVSKRGELALTRVYAEHYGPLGVRVNAVAPGPTATPLWLQPGGLLEQSGVPAEGDRAAALRERGRELPLGRHAEPAEIAAAIAFLLAAPHPNGVVWSVDGGHVTDVFP